jgi:hypothetical protein
MRLICALAVERAAYTDMINHVQRSLSPLKHGDISYEFGSIGNHNIVAACLPAGMTDSAVTVARTFEHSGGWLERYLDWIFSSISFGQRVQWWRSYEAEHVMWHRNIINILVRSTLTEGP